MIGRTPTAWQRQLCFTLALALCLTSFPPPSHVWAAGNAPLTAAPSDARSLNLAQLDLVSLTIPERLGEVVDRWQPPGRIPRAFVIHLQDVHAHPEAQQHLSQLIGDLHQRLGIQVVGVEGAEGHCDTALYSDLPDPASTERIARLFMREGLFTGAEYYAVTHPGNVTVWGVEDQALYQQHEQARRRGMEASARAETTLAQLRALIAQRIAAAYPQRLQQLLHLQQLEQEDGTPERVERYTRELVALARATQISLKVSPRVRALAFAQQLYDQLDMRRVEAERDRLVSALQPLLAPPEMRALAAMHDTANQRSAYEQLAKIAAAHHMSLAGQGDRPAPLSIGQTLLAFVRRQAASSAPTYRALRQYLAYLRLSETIRTPALRIELSALEESVQEVMLTNDRQRALARLRSAITLLDGLVHAKLSPDQYADYAQYRGALDVDTLWQTLIQAAPDQHALTKPAIKQLVADVPTYEQFYALALQRNDALVRHMLDRLEETRAAGGVLIAGGFHTPGITTQLKAHDIAYIVIAPRMSTRGDDARYHARLQNQMPSVEELARKLDQQTLAPADVTNPQSVLYQAAFRTFVTLKTHLLHATNWLATWIQANPQKAAAYGLVAVVAGKAIMHTMTGDYPLNQFDLATLGTIPVAMATTPTGPQSSNAPGIGDRGQGTESGPRSTVGSPQRAEESNDQLRERFNDYLRQEHLDGYKSLEALFDPTNPERRLVMEALLEDPALQPVFALVLPDEALGPHLEGEDSAGVAAVGGMNVLRSHCVFSVNEPIIANRLLKENPESKLIVGVTDRSSPLTLDQRFKIANRRSVYFPLPDGTWLKVKGAGQFGTEDQRAYFWDVRLNRYTGLAQINEALHGVAGRDALQLNPQRWEQFLGYRRLRAAPNRAGQLESLANLFDGISRVEPVLIFAHVRQPHRLTKLPQLLLSDSGLRKLCQRVSKILIGAGELPIGHVLSASELMMLIMRRLGQSEADKQNREWFKFSIHEQDFTFAGEEADVDELLPYEAYIQQEHVQMLQRQFDLLRRTHVGLDGIGAKVDMLVKMVGHTKEIAARGELFPAPMETLHAFWAGYFEQLDDQYLSSWLSSADNEISETLQLAAEDIKLEVFHENIPRHASPASKELRQEVLQTIQGWAQAEWDRRHLHSGEGVPGTGGHGKPVSGSEGTGTNTAPASTQAITPTLAPAVEKTEPGSTTGNNVSETISMPQHPKPAAESVGLPLPTPTPASASAEERMPGPVVVAPPSTPTLPGAGGTVLLLDPDQDQNARTIFRNRVQRITNGAGTVIIAETLEEALEHMTVGGSSIRAVFTEEPRGGGLDTLMLAATTQKIPVIMLTGWPTPEKEARWKAHGVDLIVDKGGLQREGYADLTTALHRVFEAPAATSAPAATAVQSETLQWTNDALHELKNALNGVTISLAVVVSILPDPRAKEELEASLGLWRQREEQLVQNARELLNHPEGDVESQARQILHEISMLLVDMRQGARAEESRVQPGHEKLFRRIYDRLDAMRRLVEEATRPPIPIETNVEQALEDALVMLDTIAPRVTSRGLESMPFVWAVYFDRILTNLIRNAAARAQHIHVEAAYDPQHEEVMVTVTDDGPGFPQALLEPDAKGRPLVLRERSSRTEGGSGVGLTSTARFIEQVGGRMHIENLASPRQGARIVLYLPAIGLWPLPLMYPGQSRQELAARLETMSTPEFGAYLTQFTTGRPYAVPTTTESAIHPSGEKSATVRPVIETSITGTVGQRLPSIGPHVPGTLRVVIVDDDDSSRESMSDYFSMKFHAEVLTAPDAEHGLALIQEEQAAGRPIHGVITDMNMGAMSGDQLAQAILADYPNILVVIWTGLNVDTEASVRALVKQYGLEELYQKQQVQIFGKGLGIVEALPIIHANFLEKMKGTMVSDTGRLAAPKPKSMVLTMATAGVWAILAGWLGAGDSAWWQVAAIMPALFSFSALADLGIMTYGVLRTGRYELIDAFQGRAPPTRRWRLAENVGGEIITANRTILTGLPPWLQAFYAQREQLALQRVWGGDALTHLIIDPVLLLVRALRRRTSALAVSTEPRPKSVEQQWASLIGESRWRWLAQTLRDVKGFDPDEFVQSMNGPPAAQKALFDFLRQLHPDLLYLLAADDPQRLSQLLQHLIASREFLGYLEDVSRSSTRWQMFEFERQEFHIIDHMELLRSFEVNYPPGWRAAWAWFQQRWFQLIWFIKGRWVALGAATVSFARQLARTVRLMRAPPEAIVNRVRHIQELLAELTPTLEWGDVLRQASQIPESGQTIHSYNYYYPTDNPLPLLRQSRRTLHQLDPVRMRSLLVLMRQSLPERYLELHQLGREHPLQLVNLLDILNQAPGFEENLRFASRLPRAVMNDWKIERLFRLLAMEPQRFQDLPNRLQAMYGSSIWWPTLSNETLEWIASADPGLLERFSRNARYVCRTAREFPTSLELIQALAELSEEESRRIGESTHTLSSTFHTAYLSLILRLMHEAQSPDGRQAVVSLGASEIKAWELHDEEEFARLDTVHAAVKTLKGLTPDQCVELIATMIRRRDVSGVIALADLAETGLDRGELRSFRAFLVSTRASYTRKMQMVILMAEWMRVLNASTGAGRIAADQRWFGLLTAFEEYTSGVMGWKALERMVESAIHDTARALLEQLVGVPIPEALLQDQVLLQRLLVVASLSVGVGSLELDEHDRQVLLDRTTQAIRVFVTSGGDHAAVRRAILEEIPENREEIERLVRAGYDRRLWQDGIALQGFASTSLTDAAKTEQRARHGHQIVEIAKRMQLIPGEDLTAIQLTSYDEAKQFVEERILAKRDEALTRVSEDAFETSEADLLNILREFQRLELAQAAEGEERAVTVVVRKDFISEANAGVGVPGCFNPFTGIHREMPIVHGLEANGLFAIAYDASGRMIANVVLALTDEGVVVFGDYNRTALNLDPLWHEAWKELLRRGYVPRIILGRTSAGRRSAEGQGTLHAVRAIRRGTLWHDPYFDFGEVEEATGAATFTQEGAVVLTAAAMRQSHGDQVTERLMREWASKQAVVAQAAARIRNQRSMQVKMIADRLAAAPALRPYLVPLMKQVNATRVPLTDLVHEQLGEWLEMNGTNGAVDPQAAEAIWVIIQDVVAQSRVTGTNENTASPKTPTAEPSEQGTPRGAHPRILTAPSLAALVGSQIATGFGAPWWVGSLFLLGGMLLTVSWLLPRQMARRALAGLLLLAMTTGVIPMTALFYRAYESVRPTHQANSQAASETLLNYLQQRFRSYGTQDLIDQLVAHDAPDLRLAIQRTLEERADPAMAARLETLLQHGTDLDLQQRLITLLAILGDRSAAQSLELFAVEHFGEKGAGPVVLRALMAAEALKEKTRPTDAQGITVIIVKALAAYQDIAGTTRSQQALLNEANDQLRAWWNDEVLQRVQELAILSRFLNSALSQQLADQPFPSQWERRLVLLQQDAGARGPFMRSVVKAVARVESWLKPEAKSRQNAYGLMGIKLEAMIDVLQHNRSFAQELADTYGGVFKELAKGPKRFWERAVALQQAKKPQPQTLSTLKQGFERIAKDPELNLIIGWEYLDLLITYYQERGFDEWQATLVALAAYNGGWGIDQYIFQGFEPGTAPKGAVPAIRTFDELQAQGHLRPETADYVPKAAAQLLLEQREVRSGQRQQAEQTAQAVRREQSSIREAHVAGTRTAQVTVSEGSIGSHLARFLGRLMLGTLGVMFVITASAFSVSAAEGPAAQQGVSVFGTLREVIWMHPILAAIGVLLATWWLLMERVGSRISSRALGSALRLLSGGWQMPQRLGALSVNQFHLLALQGGEPFAWVAPNGQRFTDPRQVRAAARDAAQATALGIETLQVPIGTEEPLTLQVAGWSALPERYRSEGALRALLEQALAREHDAQDRPYTLAALAQALPERTLTLILPQHYTHYAGNCTHDGIVLLHWRIFKDPQDRLSGEAGSQAAMEALLLASLAHELAAHELSGADNAAAHTPAREQHDLANLAAFAGIHVETLQQLLGHPDVLVQPIRLPGVRAHPVTTPQRTKKTGADAASSEPPAMKQAPIQSHGMGIEAFNASPARLKVVDLGSGNGDFIAQYRQVHPDVAVIGFDLLPHPSAATVEQPPSTVSIVQDASTTGIAPQSVDLVTINMPDPDLVLSQPERWNAWIEEAVRVLKPGGMLYIVSEASKRTKTMMSDDDAYSTDVAKEHRRMAAIFRTSLTQHRLRVVHSGVPLGQVEPNYPETVYIRYHGGRNNVWLYAGRKPLRSSGDVTDQRTSSTTRTKTQASNALGTLVAGAVAGGLTAAALVATVAVAGSIGMVPAMLLAAVVSLIGVPITVNFISAGIRIIHAFIQDGGIRGPDGRIHLRDLLITPMATPQGVHPAFRLLPQRLQDSIRYHEIQHPAWGEIGAHVFQALRLPAITLLAVPPMGYVLVGAGLFAFGFDVAVMAGRQGAYGYSALGVLSVIVGATLARFHESIMRGLQHKFLMFWPAIPGDQYLDREPVDVADLVGRGWSHERMLALARAGGVRGFEPEVVDQGIALLEPREAVGAAINEAIRRERDIVPAAFADENVAFLEELPLSVLAMIDVIGANAYWRDHGLAAYNRAIAHVTRIVHDEVIRVGGRIFQQGIQPSYGPFMNDAIVLWFPAHVGPATTRTALEGIRQRVKQELGLGTMIGAATTFSVRRKSTTAKSLFRAMSQRISQAQALGGSKVVASWGDAAEHLRGTIPGKDWDKVEAMMRAKGERARRIRRLREQYASLDWEEQLTPLRLLVAEGPPVQRQVIERANTNTAWFRGMMETSGPVWPVLAVVGPDGRYRLIDGFHRVTIASQITHQESIPAFIGTPRTATNFRESPTIPIAESEKTTESPRASQDPSVAAANLSRAPLQGEEILNALWFRAGHPAGGYHQWLHSKNVGELAYLLARGRGLSEEDAVFLAQVGWVHDFDPERPDGIRPRVPSTMEILARDFMGERGLDGTPGRSILREMFGWDERRFWMALAIIQRSEFPFGKEHYNPAYAGSSPLARYRALLMAMAGRSHELDAADQAFVLGLTGQLPSPPFSTDDIHFTLYEAPIFSEYADKMNWLVMTDFTGVLETTQGLADEINAEQQGTGKPEVTLDTLNPYQFQLGLGVRESFTRDREVAAELRMWQSMQFSDRDAMIAVLPIRHQHAAAANLAGLQAFWQTSQAYPRDHERAMTAGVAAARHQAYARLEAFLAGQRLNRPFSIETIARAIGTTIEEARVQVESYQADYPGRVFLRTDGRYERHGAFGAATPAEYEPQPGAVAQPSASALALPKRVLVVDDSELTRNMLREQILQVGVAEVLMAANGEEALQLLAHEAVDGVLSDVNMPRMDGRQLAETLHAQHPELPLVLVTSANDLSWDELEALDRTGAAAIFTDKFGSIKQALSVIAQRQAALRAEQPAPSAGKNVSETIFSGSAPAAGQPSGETSGTGDRRHETEGGVSVPAGAIGGPGGHGTGGATPGPAASVKFPVLDRWTNQLVDVRYLPANELNEIERRQAVADLKARWGESEFPHVQQQLLSLLETQGREPSTHTDLGRFRLVLSDEGLEGFALISLPPWHHPTLNVREVRAENRWTNPTGQRLQGVGSGLLSEAMKELRAKRQDADRIYIEDPSDDGEVMYRRRLGMDTLPMIMINDDPIELGHRYLSLTLTQVDQLIDSYRVPASAAAKGENVSETILQQASGEASPMELRRLLSKASGELSVLVLAGRVEDLPNQAAVIRGLLETYNVDVVLTPSASLQGLWVVEDDAKFIGVDAPQALRAEVIAAAKQVHALSQGRKRRPVESLRDVKVLHELRVWRAARPVEEKPEGMFTVVFPPDGVIKTPAGELEAIELYGTTPHLPTHQLIDIGPRSVEMYSAILGEANRIVVLGAGLPGDYTKQLGQAIESSHATVIVADHEALEHYAGLRTADHLHVIDAHDPAIQAVLQASSQTQVPAPATEPVGRGSPERSRGTTGATVPATAGRPQTTPAGQAAAALDTLGPAHQLREAVEQLRHHPEDAVRKNAIAIIRNIQQRDSTVIDEVVNGYANAGVILGLSGHRGDLTVHVEKLARQMGLEGSGPQEAGLIAYELSLNISEHADFGIVLVQAAKEQQREGVEFLAYDIGRKGRGITDIPSAITKHTYVPDVPGESTGLARVRNWTDELTIESEGYRWPAMTSSQVQYGTVIVARRWKSIPSLERMRNSVPPMAPAPTAGKNVSETISSPQRPKPAAESAGSSLPGSAPTSAPSTPEIPTKDKKP